MIPAIVPMTIPAIAPAERPWLVPDEVIGRVLPLAVAGAMNDAVVVADTNEV